MSASPALKIVRHSKTPGVVVGGARVAGVQPTRTPPVADDGPLPFTMTDAEIAHELRLSAKSIRQ